MLNVMPSHVQRKKKASPIDERSLSFTCELIAFVASVGLALGKLHSHAHAAHAAAHAAHVHSAALFVGGVGDHGFDGEYRIHKAQFIQSFLDV